MDQQQQQGQQQEVLREQGQQQEVLHEQEEQQQQEVLQEWLTPMTQSELDYEQKKKDQEKLNSLDTERRTQLNWIETEIQRLRKLQQLLHDVQQPASRVESNIMPCGKEVTHLDQNAEAATVQREKILSKTLRAAPPPPHAEKLCSPAAALNIPIVAVPAATVAPCAPNKRQQQQQQRSKMATPPLSHSGGSSESVCSFVQQRQRQFMAHYQNQQQQRLEQQHQQKQLLRLQQHQQMRQQQHQQFFSMQQQLEAHAAAGSTCHMVSMANIHCLCHTLTLPVSLPPSPISLSRGHINSTANTISNITHIPPSSNSSSTTCRWPTVIAAWTRALSTTKWSTRRACPAMCRQQQREQQLPLPQPQH